MDSLTETKEAHLFKRQAFGGCVYENCPGNIKLDRPQSYAIRRRIAKWANNQKIPHFLSPFSLKKDKDLYNLDSSSWGGIVFPKNNISNPRRPEDVNVYVSPATHVEIKRALSSDTSPDYVMHPHPEWTEIDLFHCIRKGHRFLTVSFRVPNEHYQESKMPEPHEIKAVLEYLSPSFYCYDYGDHTKYFAYRPTKKIPPIENI